MKDMGREFLCAGRLNGHGRIVQRRIGIRRAFCESLPTVPMLYFEGSWIDRPVLRVSYYRRVRHPSSRIKAATGTTKRDREQIPRLLLNLNAECVRTTSLPEPRDIMWLAALYLFGAITAGDGEERQA
jgi:hypothetical protein